MATPTISQSPAIVNLAFVAGDTISFDVTINDAIGHPIDVSLYTFTSFIIIEDSQINFTITPIDLPLGQVHVEMLDTDSINVIDGSEWRFVVSPDVGKQFTYMLGTVKLQQR